MTEYPQRKDLEAATKEAMGYTTKARNCQSCLHSYTKPDPEVSQLHHLHCTYSNLCHFQVENEHSCAMFEANTEANRSKGRKV